ncbi:MAG: VTT domain-containing protein [Chloroflexota bacterium]
MSVPQQLAAMPSGSAGVVGTSLLVADVVLPVPSSLVMVAHGAIFGVGVGTVLSVLGSLGAALVGFALGRSGSPLLNRFVPPHEQDRANQLLAKWGLLAIVLTRSVPLMAETTAVMAGASPMIGWRGMTLASVAGSLPIALIYAVTGATAMLLDSTMLTVGLVLLVAGLFWLLERYGLPILQTQKSMSFPKEIL